MNYAYTFEPESCGIWNFDYRHKLTIVKNFYPVNFYLIGMMKNE